MIENLEPQQAFELLQHHEKAVLIDVRTKIEHDFVGRPPNAVHIPWKEAPDWQLNPNFVSEVTKQVPDKNAPVLLLCRSGQRSLEAAQALEQAGYQRLINIVGGFEGPLDHNKQRGQLGGWRFAGLPWLQS
ncbi:rhodanese-like domain-containing protein [Methylocucumis oryzae]|uniref:Sulfurtransferase n=1 Tax=Methylocucumis oryzae TaxID=1632867 RepID=A0A0F3IKA9_9GAMM|nr:rhodanese-like domain-containing protein [Methylocucumis oryzae]KJV06983.1 sulfurtransferase [Methylocucumis oryzae]